MKIFLGIKPALIQSSSLALGFFDGVHPGHQAVIKKAIEESRRLGITPAIITFKEHPRTLTLGKSPPLLTLSEQRLAICQALGSEAALLLSFTEELCKLTPQEYVQQVLVDCMGARSISVGYNHRFGRNREGTPELLSTLGEKMSFSVHVAKEVLIEGAEVSSSRIREALIKGDITLANKLLGRPYALPGVIIAGQGRGRLIGFPTANLQTAEELVLPKQGVYSGICQLNNNQSFSCVINIGTRPTFETADTKPSLEIHILDFNGNLYGQKLSVELLHYIRPEQKFPSAEALKAQISQDCLLARQLLAQNVQTSKA